MLDSEKVLCDSLTILDFNNRSSSAPCPEYGENDLRLLCDKFSVNFSAVKMEYRNLKDGQDISKCPAMQSLCHRINTIPVSTAECERGFIKMNVVCGVLRSSLTVKHLSSLMFVSLTAPPLDMCSHCHMLSLGLLQITVALMTGDVQ